MFANKIVWTETDEAPNLASYALLPVIERFSKPYGIELERKDISVAGRLISQFPEYLNVHQK